MTWDSPKFSLRQKKKALLKKLTPLKLQKSFTVFRSREVRVPYYGQHTLRKILTNLGKPRGKQGR